MQRNTLTATERRAIELAQAEGWGVVVEARDGSRRQLRRGRRGYTLVITLAVTPAEGIMTPQRAPGPGARSAHL